MAEINEQNSPEIVNKPEETGKELVMRDKEGKFVEGHPPMGGRPTGSISITEAVKRRLQEMTPDQKRTYLDVFVDKILKGALIDEKDPTQRLLWNYIDGMPKQSLDIGGTGQMPFTIKIVKDNGGTTTTEGTNS